MPFGLFHNPLPWLGPVAVAALTGAAAAGPGAATLEDFEGYATTQALLDGGWSPLLPGEPNLSLETDTPRAGARALACGASTSGGPVDVAVYTLAQPSNWTGSDHLSMWFRLADASLGAAAGVQVILQTTSGQTVVTGPEVTADSAAWGEYRLSLAGADLSDVRRVLLAVRPLDGSEATLLVDDITLASAPLRIDTALVSHELLGLGAQVWPGDSKWRQLVQVLDFRFVRMSIGPNWDALASQPPSNVTQAEMNTYVAANFDGDFQGRLSSAVSSVQYAQSNGIDVVLNHFKIPNAWLDDNDNLRSSNLDEFAEFWAAVLTLLDANGVRPDYVELANEPNGDWNGHISPSRYNTLVKLARQAFDDAGFTDVGIVGPGLSEMRLNDQYFAALDQDAVEAIAAWSTHTWDDSADWSARFAVFTDEIDAVDPGRTKPVFATEFATSVSTFDGVSYSNNEGGGPLPASEAGLFPIEVLRNTVRLLNGGVGVPLYWEAADQSFNSLTWGLMDRSGQYRPTANALFPVVNNAGPGSFVLENVSGNDGLLAVQTPAQTDTASVLVVSVNPDADAGTRCVEVDSSLVAGAHSAWLYSASGGLTPYQVSVDEFGLTTFEQPAASVVTFELDVVAPQPCVSDFNADGAVDFFDVIEAARLYDAGDTSLDRASPAGVTVADLLAALRAIEEGCE